MQTNPYWLCLIPALILGGCSKHEEKKAATQVAVKVNADEISVHQLNALLAKAEGVNAENAARAKREILDKLVDQQLAVQQAIEKRLDRNPNIMQAIEAAKAEVLARAYLEQIAGALPKPTVDEARTFYAEHPELFAQRRVFNLQEIMMPASAREEVKQLVGQSKTMQDIANGLKAKNIRFGANAGVRTAEQIPLDLLPKYSTLKEGQIAVIEAAQTTHVVLLLAAQIQPIDEAAAIPRIQQYLANQRNAETIGKELKQLREKAKIEFVGEFAAIPAAEAAPPAPAAASEAAKADAKPAAPLSDNALQKGVAGLK